MGSRQRCLLLLLAALLAACGGQQPGASALATALEVGVSPSVVEMIMHVTTTGESPTVFHFPSSQRYDFRVAAESGEEVWRWSDGQMFTQALVSDTLASGETWRLMAEWEPGDRRGWYTAVGVLTAGDTPLEQRVTFELR